MFLEKLQMQKELKEYRDALIEYNHKVEIQKQKPNIV